MKSKLQLAIMALGILILCAAFPVAAEMAPLCPSPATWTGSTDRDWFLFSNWDSGCVPDSATEVIVPTTPVGGVFPIIGGSSAAETASLLVESDASLEIEPGSSLNVTGVLTNNGTLIETQALTESADNSFLGTGGYGGVTINYSACAVALGGGELIVCDDESATTVSATVEIRGNQACDSANSSVRRCFDITAEGFSLADVTFFVSLAELNGSTCANLVPYHWNGGSWDAVGTGLTRDCSGDPVSVKAQNVSNFSPFSLGDAVPTVVQFEGIEVQEPVAPFLLAALFGAMLVATLASVALRIFGRGS